MLNAISYVAVLADGHPIWALQSLLQQQPYTLLWLVSQLLADTPHNLLQAERFVLKRTADVIDRELGHPADWAPMLDTNTQLFEVDLSDPTVAGIVTSLQETGATVVKVGLGTISLQHASTVYMCHYSDLCINSVYMY